MRHEIIISSVTGLFSPGGSKNNLDFDLVDSNPIILNCLNDISDFCATISGVLTETIILKKIKANIGKLLVHTFCSSLG